MFYVLTLKTRMIAKLYEKKYENRKSLRKNKLDKKWTNRQ